MTHTLENAAQTAWGWRAAVDCMDANHCRYLLALGKPALAIMGWADADIRQMERIAAA